VFIWPHAAGLGYYWRAAPKTAEMRAGMLVARFIGGIFPADRGGLAQTLAPGIGPLYQPPRSPTHRRFGRASETVVG